MKTRISIYNLLILFKNFMDAKGDSRIGYQELNKTEKQFIDNCNKRVSVSQELLESLLYYSNLRDEDGNFWHPDKYSFKRMVSRLLTGIGPNKVFNYFSNTIEDKEKESKDNV